MRKKLLFALCLFALQNGSAQQLRLMNISVQPETFSLPSTPSSIVQLKTKRKKISLTERLLQKWYKKKMYALTDVEKEKKAIKRLSLLSVIASLFGPFTVLLAFTSASPGIFVTAGILFCVAAIILGFVALKKIKNLPDKNGISKAPALTGIIIAGIFLLTILGLFAFVNW